MFRSIATTARWLFVLLCAAGLSGCIKFQVKEDYWLNPGAVAIDEARLRELGLPEGYKLERVEIRTADGTRLRGLHLRAPTPVPTVYYFGGDNFMLGRHGLEVAAELARQGVGVFVLDYRGYGESEGKPSLDTLMADPEAGLAELRRRGAQRVILHGMSMGSFIAAELANRQPVEGLVLESTATTVRDWAKYQVPWYAKPFVRIQLAAALENQSNTARLTRYDGPLLLLAGGRDKITPAKMARKLFESSATPLACRELLVAPEGGHGGLLSFEPAQAAYRRLRDRAQAACSP